MEDIRQVNQLLTLVRLTSALDEHQLAGYERYI